MTDSHEKSVRAFFGREEIDLSKPFIIKCTELKIMKDFFTREKEMRIKAMTALNKEMSFPKEAYEYAAFCTTTMPKVAELLERALEKLEKCVSRGGRNIHADFAKDLRAELEKLK